jgi:phosphoesterase RecJ-like protein
MSASLQDVAQKLDGAQKILVTCHRGPDGDSMGSMVALAALLRDHDKEATLYSPDPVPRMLKWLPLTKTVVHELDPAARFDATLIVDCGDAKLLGDSFPKPEVTGTLIAIDHHRSHEPFGDLFWTDPNAASVGIMVFRLAKAKSWGISPAAAQGLFVSIVSDTGWFKNSNTNAEVFKVAAELTEECGVDPWLVQERMNDPGPLQRYKLLAAALGTLTTSQNGRLAFMHITHEMVKKCGASWEDSEGLVNYPRFVKGVECGVLITPAKHGGVRISLRSKGQLIDAGAVCQSLGGGGHPGAAGCTIDGVSLEDARTQIEYVLVQALEAAAKRVGA